MSLSNSGAQIFISLTTAMVMLVAILLGAKWGLTSSTAIVFMQMAPNLFTPVQRLVGSYTMYQSLVPGIVSTYELIDTKPTVVESAPKISAKFMATSNSTMSSSVTRRRRLCLIMFPLKSKKVKRSPWSAGSAAENPRS